MDDIKLVKKTYQDSMLNLGILTQSEVNQLFGDLHHLLPVHEDLIKRLTKIRNCDGITESVGLVLLQWVSLISKGFDGKIIHSCQSKMPFFLTFGTFFSNFF